MKKLFITTITLFLLANYSNAQQLSDYYDASASNRPEFSYDVSIQIKKNTSETDDAKKYSATLIKASPDSKGFYNSYIDSKFYSCAQLGNVCNPNNFKLLGVTIYYSCNGQEKVTSISFRGLNTTEYIPTVIGVGGKFCESKDFTSIEVRSVIPINLDQIIDKINQINTTTDNQNKTNSATQSIGNQSNNNTSTGQIPDDYNGNPLHYNNPSVNTGSSAVDSFNKGYQQGQQITEIATGLVELFTPSPEQIQRREKAAVEYERQKKIKKDMEWQQREIEYANRFDLLYLPLMETALKGDENARMILYFSSINLLSGQKVPQRNEWLKEARANNNMDAVLEMVPKLNYDIDKNEGIPYYENAANMGSTDAMLRLAAWYDRKKSEFGHGGENPKLAIEYYTKAAELGSPNAMYYLGMIYKYGVIEDLSAENASGRKIIKKYHVTYEVIEDEKKAFNLFLKSEQPDYKMSNFYKGTFEPSWICSGSYFNKGTYRELAIIYKQGKIIPQDKLKAKEYQTKYETYKLDKDF
jgi:hypothetical protein